MEKPPLESAFEYHKQPTLLSKASDRPLTRLRALARAESKGQRKRGVVKFRPLHADDLSSDSDEDDDNETKVDDILSTPPPKRRTSTHSSTSKTLTNSSGSRTLTKDGGVQFDYEQEVAKLSGVKRGAMQGEPGDSLDYSDFEEDVTASITERHARNAPGWNPPFLARHQSTRGLQEQDHEYGPNGVGAVPLTPSLIHAMDRIAVAQAEAFAPRGASPGLPTPVGMPVPGAGNRAVGLQSSSPMGGEYGVSKAKGEEWETFWQDVKNKAGEAMRAQR